MFIFIIYDLEECMSKSYVCKFYFTLEKLLLLDIYVLLLLQL